MASSAEPSQLEHDSKLFMEMFGLAVDTTNDQEEDWAYHKMRDAYCRLMGNPPPSREDPKMPQGFFEAMRWAAELRVATSKLSSTPSSP